MRISILLFFGLLALQACKEDPTKTPQYQQLEEDSRRGEAMVAERDSTINELFGTVNRISENLRTVRTKQGQLATPGEGMEKGADLEKRVMADI
ncbi:MAG TPA: hypothetical protein VKG92_02535, partial [Flavobacteriales bacterium]|nr:hypothetical protein [Flavobacteriales bacterium]